MSRKKGWHSRRQKLYITNPSSPLDRLALVIYRVTLTDFDARRPGTLGHSPAYTFPLLRGRVSFRGRTYHVGGASRAQVVARLTALVMDEKSQPPKKPKKSLKSGRELDAKS